MTRRITSLLFIMFFLVIMLFLFLSGMARAGPFLICDPQTDVTHYVVTIDGQTETVPAFDLGDGTVMLKYDLSNVSEGQHICEIKAKNLWDESAPAPFVFTRAGPGVPGNVRIKFNNSTLN